MKMSFNAQDFEEILQILEHNSKREPLLKSKWGKTRPAWLDRKSKRDCKMADLHEMQAQAIRDVNTVCQSILSRVERAKAYVEMYHNKTNPKDAWASVLAGEEVLIPLTEYWRMWNASRHESRISTQIVDEVETMLANGTLPRKYYAHVYTGLHREISDSTYGALHDLHILCSASRATYRYTDHIGIEFKIPYETHPYMPNNFRIGETMYRHPTLAELELLALDTLGFRKQLGNKPIAIWTSHHECDEVTCWRNEGYSEGGLHHSTEVKFTNERAHMLPIPTEMTYDDLKKIVSPYR